MIDLMLAPCAHSDDSCCNDRRMLPFHSLETTQLSTDDQDRDPKTNTACSHCHDSEKTTRLVVWLATNGHDVDDISACERATVVTHPC